MAARDEDKATEEFNEMVERQRRCPPVLFGRWPVDRQVEWMEANWVVGVFDKGES